VIADCPAQVTQCFLRDLLAFDLALGRNAKVDHADAILVQDGGYIVQRLPGLASGGLELNGSEPNFNSGNPYL
jgi:hypothetical protein